MIDAAPAAGDAGVVRKRAVEPEARRRLAREAQRLSTLCHPGVVELVAHETEPDADVLVTRLAGSLTLADYAPADVGAVAGVLAAVAAVLGDLHEAGVSHGALAPDHVIVGRGRRPVLCSFGRAGGGGGREVLADLAALADLIDGVVARAKRAGRSRGLSRGLRQRRALLSAAAACRRGLPAAEVAALLAHVPGAMAPQPAMADDELPVAPVVTQAADGTRTWRDRVVSSSLPQPERSRRPRVAVLVVLAIVVVGAALTLERLSPPSPARLMRADVPGPRQQASPAARAARAALPMATAPAPAPCQGAVAGLDADGDGCADDVALQGNLVRIDQVWFAAGEAGDAVALGDWDCNGSATPLVLRPTSGDLFVFDRWAGPDSGIEERAVTRSPGAVDLAVERRGDCDVAHAVAADGTVSGHPIDLGRGS